MGDKVKERSRKGTEVVKQKTKEALDTIKQKSKETKDEVVSRVEDTRIRQALGKPVTRVILDQNDLMILNTGELITNEVIEKARTAGVLDMLLSSVYEGKPQFNQEHMRMRQGVRKNEY